MIKQPKSIGNGYEVKYAGAPRLTRSIISAMTDLEWVHLWVVHPGDRVYPLAEGVSTLSITEIGARWCYDEKIHVVRPT